MLMIIYTVAGTFAGSDDVAPVDKIKDVSGFFYVIFNEVTVDFVQDMLGVFHHGNGFPLKLMVNRFGILGGFAFVAARRAERNPDFVVIRKKAVSDLNGSIRLQPVVREIVIQIGAVQFRQGFQVICFAGIVMFFKPFFKVVVIKIFKFIKA